jgi:nucleolar protein 14
MELCILIEDFSSHDALQLRRQMEREQEDNIRHQLDQEFDSIRSLIYAPDPSSSGSNSIPLGGPSSTTESRQKTLSINVASHAEDYDQQVRELAFDKRAKPKDRTKTEEEIALEEKEALEKAERRRKLRMLGEDEVDSEEERRGGRGKRKRGAEGDDLEDDFADGSAEWDGLGAGLRELPKIRKDEDTESESESGDDDRFEEASDLETSEESDAAEGDGEIGDQEELVTTRRPRKDKLKSQLSKELPFTFPCPETHSEFLEIIECVDEKDVPTVIQRIRALYHPSLGSENKFKLQVKSRLLP